jgi:hypothetical protein
MSAQTSQVLSAETPQRPRELFAPEGWILSVLDLTRELERLGVIEITELPTGADAYRILDSEAVRKVPRQPVGEFKQRVGAIFKRRSATLWSSEEIKAFKALEIEAGDLELVEAYYRSEVGKEGSYTRTSLLTFLRHYPGEVDRARRWKEASLRKHCY